MILLHKLADRTYMQNFQTAKKTLDEINQKKNDIHFEQTMIDYNIKECNSSSEDLSHHHKTLLTMHKHVNDPHHPDAVLPQASPNSFNGEIAI